MTTTKKVTKKEMAIQLKENAREELMNLMEKYGFTIWTKLEHVSRSGMLRRISCFVIDRETGFSKDITHLVSKLGGYKEDPSKPGLRVSGCGMDMGFSVVYNTSVATYCKDGYTHDGAYKISQKWV